MPSLNQLNQMKNYNYKPITLTALILISSCAKEDDIQYITETITETEYITVIETQVVEIPVTTVQTVTVEIPYSYEYARDINGSSV